MSLWQASLRVVVSLFIVAHSCEIVNGGNPGHRYKKGERMELWVNSIGPYYNPQEIYGYYTLPFCTPKNNRIRFTDELWHLQTIGEQLQGGYALRSSGYDITFNPIDTETIESCETAPLTESEVEQWKRAVHQRWFFNIFLDDLPMWGMVGEDHLFQPMEASLQFDSTGHSGVYVYTGRILYIAYNGDQIIRVDLLSDTHSLKVVKVGEKLNFTLRVRWEQTIDDFQSRFERYLDREFFQHPVHWMSIFNPLLVVMGCAALILLRTLKRDYARYSLVHDMEEASDDNNATPTGISNSSSNGESGWKQVHGDVFRAPSRLSFFSALIGCGWQLAASAFGVLVHAVLCGRFHGAIHEERGELIHATLIWYSLSSIIAGYQSGRVFKLYYSTTTTAAAAARTNSAPTPTTPSLRCFLRTGLTVILIPAVSASILLVLNVIARYYGTIKAIPNLAIVKLFFIWVFFSIPLCVAGFVLASHYGPSREGVDGTSYFPCHINDISRPIPEELPRFGKAIYLIPIAGLLTFSSICIELFYVFTSLWSYKLYVMYGFLLGVYTVLTFVVGVTSIVVVYLCLSAENWKWHWVAFGSGASTGVYIFLYGIYYFFAYTSMRGILQTSFYFGYVILIAIHIGLLCGALGHAAATSFVRAIFKNVKVD